MDQAEEIVQRNKGNIDDLLNHINQEIHISAIIHLRLPSSLYKIFLNSKIVQLQEIKIELLQAQIEYQNNLKN